MTTKHMNTLNSDFLSYVQIIPPQHSGYLPLKDNTPLQAAYNDIILSHHLEKFETMLSQLMQQNTK